MDETLLNVTFLVYYPMETYLNKGYINHTFYFSMVFKFDNQVSYAFLIQRRKS